MASSAKVLAAGFNLHRQLGPSTEGILNHFTEICSLAKEDQGAGRVIQCALWSATIIDTGMHLIHYGISGTNPDRILFDHLLGSDGKPRRGTFFGDVSGVKGFLDHVAGELYILHNNGKNDARFEKHHVSTYDFLAGIEGKVTHIAIAGNGMTCVITSERQPVIHVFADIGSLLEGSDPIESYQTDGSTKTLVASSTNFNTLAQERLHVETFGDARYPSLLGRIPSVQAPASVPTVISALDGIPIAKISAQNWLVTALSCEKDLYVWGHVLHRAFHVDHSCFDELLNRVNEDGRSEDVHLIDIGESSDIEDVAVGDDHLVVLTTRGEVWGYGSNDFGQLGLGPGVKSTEATWVPIYKPSQGNRVVEIAAGPLNTFLVVGDG
ncbi:MAG: hypothetical protein Q9182_000576 [Xanthomendoza sp. 2 TL-2023]